MDSVVLSHVDKRCKSSESSEEEARSEARSLGQKLLQELLARDETAEYRFTLWGKKDQYYVKLWRFLDKLQTALPSECQQAESRLRIRLLVPHPEAAGEDHQVREDILLFWLQEYPNLVVDWVQLEVDGEVRKSEAVGDKGRLRSRTPSGAPSSNFSFLSILRFHEAADVDVVFSRDADNDPDVVLELQQTIKAVESGKVAYGVRKLGDDLGGNWVTFRSKRESFGCTAMALFLRRHPVCQYTDDEKYLKERYPDAETFPSNQQITPCCGLYQSPELTPGVMKGMQALQQKATAWALERPGQTCGSAVVFAMVMVAEPREARDEGTTEGTLIERGGFSSFCFFFASDPGLSQKLLARKVESTLISGGVKQMDLSPSLAEGVEKCAHQCNVIKSALKSVFGVEKFEVNRSSCKKLSGGEKQIPHVDALSVEELFVVVHLRPDQVPTFGVPVSCDDVMR